MNTLPKIYDMSAMYDFLGLTKPGMHYENRMSWLSYNMASDREYLYSAMARHLMFVDGDLEEAKRFQDLASAAYQNKIKAIDSILSHIK